MSLNPVGAGSNYWNYSNEANAGYSLELWGTIVSLQEVQAYEFGMGNGPRKPKFWPDGNPVMNIRVGFATPDGSLKCMVFNKAGKKQVSGEKPSLHMQLYGLTNGNMMELLGKTVHLWTWPANPQTGVVWGRGNPRLFGVEEVTDGTKYELSVPLPEEFKVAQLFADNAAAGGQPMPPNPQQMARQPQQYANTMPMQGGFYAAPQVPQYPQYHMQQPQPMPQYQQPMQPVQPMQPMQQQAPMSAPMPQGMDPQVAQAMQAAGAVNIQPVAGDGGMVYDDDMPF